MRRALTIAALIAAGLVCARLALPARPRVLTALDGSARSPLAASGRWLVWLEGDDQQSRLMLVSRRGGRSRALLAAPRLSGLAVSGDTAYVTRGPAARGGAESGSARPALLAVSLKTGAARTIAEVPEQADQILGSQRWIVWRRARQSGLSGIPFVAAAAPMTAIRSAPVEGGPVRIVAVLRGEARFHRDDVVLLGIAGDALYWRQRSGTSASSKTLIRRAPCAGTGVETVVEETGSRNAALGGDVLVWTAQSLEAGSPASFAAVRKMALGKPGAKVIADWLDPGAMPLPTADGAVYAQDRGSLWVLGDRPGAQRRLFTGPSQVTSPLVSDHEQFMFLQRGSQTVVAKRPLSLWTRVRSLVNW